LITKKLVRDCRDQNFGQSIDPELSFLVTKKLVITKILVIDHQKIGQRLS